MGRQSKIAERKRINVWLLRNQVRDMEKIKESTGKSLTSIIGEALAVWLSLMRREGLL